MRTAWMSAGLSASRACWNSSVNVEMKWSGGAVGLENCLGVGVVSKSLVRSRT